VFFFFAGDGESDPTVSRFFLAAVRGGDTPPLFFDPVAFPSVFLGF
jgi:hypothetical protein